ncbi:hypothetical protein BD626DRAFT_399539, partial [Schizophyllum amplum]
MLIVLRRLALQTPHPTTHYHLPSEPCIKGHRTTGCQHADRPLQEVRRKGRPTTQCGHCRELRKVKQVHIHCQCMTK